MAPIFLDREAGIQIYSQVRLALPFRRRRSVAAGLADIVLVARRFLHLGAHGTEIVGRGNHREQDNQRTSQRQQALGRGEPAAVSHASRVAPQPIGRQRQQEPCEIEQQFHLRANIPETRTH